MKTFIAKKPTKRKFKCYYLGGIFIFLLLLYNMKYIDSNNLNNILLHNSYGQIFLEKKENNYLFLNAYGLELDKTIPTLKEETKEEIKEEPLIYLYNTFASKKYAINSITKYRVTPTVKSSLQILKEYLNNLNITSIIEETKISEVLKNNNLGYESSYQASRILLENAKNNNPTLKYFFDLDRSDDPKDLTTYTDSLSYAKVLFIIGTDNPNYQENLKLAQVFNDVLEAKNKELSRGISMRGGAGYQGVYNEDFSKNTLLIYVGGVDNTIDEVNLTLKVLAEVIKEGIDIYEKEEK